MLTAVGTVPGVPPVSTADRTISDTVMPAEGFEIHTWRTRMLFVEK